MLLGNGLLPNVGGSPYLLRDEFTTARLAGAINGTDAEPGPGVRAITATSDAFSISGGALQMDGFTANGDPRLTYALPIVRNPGIMLAGRFNAPGTLGTCQLCFGITVGGAPRLGVVFTNSGTIYSMEGAAISTRDLGAYVAATDYDFVVIARAAGHLIFVKGGIYTNWTLLWVTTTDSQSTLYVSLAKNNNSNAGALASIRVPTYLWLPTPLASDGFGSTLVVTDGLGHAEGVAGAQGAGGSGLAWTQQVGTWATSAGSVAATALSGSLAIATVDTGVADVIATAKLTRAGGNGGVVVRYADASNFVRAIHTGTNAQMVKRIAGVETTLVDAAVTYAAGAELRLICEGQKFRLYYNGVLVGTEQTIADAGVATATKQGLRTTDTGNIFDDFVVMARGTNGEYAILDTV